MTPRSIKDLVAPEVYDGEGYTVTRIILDEGYEVGAIRVRSDLSTVDELWFLEHPPVYTLGTNTDMAHLHETDSTPVVQTDRGGQVTWHGPGQAIVYVLIDIKRARLGVRELVGRLEQAIIATLAAFGIAASGRDGHLDM